MSAGFAADDGGIPVNTVRLSESSKQLVVDECVICGETHRHGSMDPTVAGGGRSHRVEHCTGVNHSGGYFLELADDAEPPERWFRRVGGETMNAEECSICGESRSPAIEQHDDERGRFVLCWECDAEAGGVL